MMQKNIKSVLFASFLITTFLGCGNPGGTVAANQKSVDDLSTLMSAHPEFAKASLKEIKDASTEGAPVNVPATHVVAVAAVAVATDADAVAEPSASPKEKPAGNLDPKIAKDAQALIDDILDKFDFADQMRASFKLIGIQINQINEMMNMKDDFGDKTGSEKMPGFGKFDKSTTAYSPRIHDERKHGSQKFGSSYHEETHFSSKFSDDDGMKSITCEELVNNPWIKFAQDEYEKANQANNKEIKAALSGCAKIQGERFVQCIADINRLTNLIDEQATCAMKSIAELDKASGGKFTELSQSGQECMEKVFSQCNFRPKESQ